MAHWLLKSEPSSWSWDQQAAAGAKGVPWTGVRNHAAKLNMMAMKRNEQAFFYHSNEGLEIVGIVEVVKSAYPDPEAKPGEPWVLVDVRVLRPLPKRVALKQIKAEPKLAKMALVTFSRLSVQPVTDREWDMICKMGGL